ncbi:MAG: glycosyltransferase [Mucispirillum sp.]|nr:glycosyltransferase [Mucispirillum sp.]
MYSISVIIPVYNRTFSVRDAVESVLIQSVKPSEIIVIDDGSSFDMVSYLKNYMQHVRLIKLDENKGVSFARNTGIKAAQGEYIAFLDSDDLFLPKKLEYQIKYMSENNLLISHTDEFWYRKDRWVNQGKSNKRYGGYIFDKILDKCRISPSSLIVHKSVFDEAGYFDENLKVCEDYEISLRFALKYKIGYLEKKLIIKRAVEENSLSADIKHIEYIRYEILEKLYRDINNSIDLNSKKAILNEIKRKKHIISPFLTLQ